MNGKWINLTECDSKQAKNLSLDWSPIVTQCYRTTDSHTYLSDANQQSKYENIRRGDIVYHASIFEQPYFPPLFDADPSTLFTVETSPQLISRIIFNNLTRPNSVKNIVQIDDEIESRNAVFSDIFEQINRNTFAINRPSPECNFR